jgi:hypothetical protein
MEMSVPRIILNPIDVLATATNLMVEITGSQECRIVGKSQPVLTMIKPILFTRARIHTADGQSQVHGKHGAPTRWTNRLTQLTWRRPRT